MTDQEREAIRARLAAATPGEWYAQDNNIVLRRKGLAIASFTTGYGQSQKDAEFAAHAPADIAALLREVERLEDECDTWKEDSKIIGDVAANSERVELEIIAITAENARLRDKVEELKHKDDVWRKVYDGAAAERDEARAEARQWANTAQEMLQERDAIEAQLAAVEADYVTASSSATYYKGQLAQLQTKHDEVCADFAKAQDYRRSYGKGDALETAKRVVEMFMANRGKTGIGVMEQFAACEIQAHTGTTKAQLARAVELLEHHACTGCDPGGEQCADVCNFIRTTEGGDHGEA